MIYWKIKNRTYTKFMIDSLTQNYPLSDISALTGLSHNELIELKAKL